jgi:hypothetical protein
MTMSLLRTPISESPSRLGPLCDLLAVWVDAMARDSSPVCDDLAMAGDLLLALTARDDLDLFVKYDAEIRRRLPMLRELLCLCDAMLGGDWGTRELRDALTDYACPAH